nr:hypothetical protein [Tanacetum cinerariifolium]
MVTADVPEIYMQEFWATDYVHQHSIRFKMNNKKHIVNLESFRDMLHINPRTPGQSFDELPLEEEILFRLSQAQILWGLYYTRNIDYAFLIWEDFVYQVAHKNHNKSNEMYYSRFTKVIIHHFMSKDPSIPRRNKVNWHYVRDDCLFSTIKVVSRHQNTQQYGAMLPIEMTNDEIRNTKAYKEYHAFATGEAVPKPKASARRKKSDSDTSITPPTTTLTPKPIAAATPRLTAAAKVKQPAKATKAKSLSALSKSGGSGTDEGTGSKPGVPDVPSDDSEEELSWNSSDDEGADTQGKEGDDNEGDESFDPIPRTPKASEDDENDEEEHGLMTGEEERYTEEEEADELYRDVDINQGRGIHVSQDIKDSHVTLTPVNPDGQQESSSVSSQFVSSMLNPISDAGVESIFTTASTSMASLPTPTPTITPSIITTTTTSSHAPIPPTIIPSEVLQNLPTFNLVFHFENRSKSLEANFSEFSQTRPFAEAVSAIPGIVHQYINQQMTEASVNAQLKAEVLTRSSHSSRTSYAVAADLSEMELKKILIEKIEGNKSIQRSDEQRNLYKALVDAYEADKIILDTYRESVILKRRRDDHDDQGEGPSAGSDRGLRDEEKVNPKGEQYPHILLQPLPLIPDNRGRRVIPFAHFINNDLAYLQGGASSCKYTTSVTKTKAADYGNIKWIKDLFYDFAVNRESALDVYSKRRIIAVTDLKIMEWLRPQDIKDMLLLLVQEKLSNLTVEERFAFNVSFRMFTRSIVIQRRAEDLQLGVESYQKRLNLNKPDTYRSNLKRREAYTAYSNPRGFIYQNKDKKNRLMRIDELQKFSDGTLNDVRTALDDRLKGIRMQYLPQKIWRKGDKNKAAAMIQAIDKMLKTRRIMRSLEKFVGGRLYEGDFRMLQRTI